MTNANDLLRDHVTLTVDCMDRIHLNGYIPNLQVPGELVSFLTKHRGHPIPLTVVLAENPHPLKDLLPRLDNPFGLIGLISKSLSGRHVSARTGLAGRRPDRGRQ